MKTYYASSLAALLLAALGTMAHADGFSSNTKHGSIGRRDSASIENNYAKYVWLDSDDGQSAVVVDHIVVSLADQRLYAYNGQRLVAWSNVSSGRPGHDTHRLVYRFREGRGPSLDPLRRRADALLHAPDRRRCRSACRILPGYPASHGCVRLPFGMARELYQHVESGTAVDIIGTSLAENAASNPAVSSAIDLARN